MGLREKIGKALVPYDRSAASPASGRGSALIAGSTGRTSIASQMSDTYLSAYGGNQAVDWAMTCVRLIAESASTAEYHFERNGQKLIPYTTELSPADQEAAPADLVALCEQPHPWMDYAEWIQLFLIDLFMAGEHFFVRYPTIAGERPLALFRLSPSLVDVIPGESRLIDGYAYRAPGAPEPLVFPAEAVGHVKLPNPHSPYRGLSIVAGGPRAFDIEIAVTETEAQYYEQGTKLSGVLQADRNVNEPTRKKLEEAFAAFYSGRRNAYKVPLLQGGIKFQPIQPTAADAQFEAISKFSRDRIAHMFRVPLPLIGNMEQANYKIQEAQRTFDTKTMPPILDRIQRGITKAITQPFWGVDFVIDYSYVMPDEDRIKLASDFASIPGVKVKEVREHLGLVELGDDRDEWVLNLPSPNAPSRPGPGEPGRPPRGEQVPVFPAPGEPPPEGSHVQAPPGGDGG